MTDRDWAALAMSMRERRAELGLSQQDAFLLAGVSATIWNELENSRRVSMRPATARKVESALGWTRGSVDRLLSGGEAALESHGEPDLEQRVARLEGLFLSISERLQRSAREGPDVSDQIRSEPER